MACTGARTNGRTPPPSSPTGFCNIPIAIGRETKEKQRLTILLAGAPDFVSEIIFRWPRWRSAFRNLFIALTSAPPKFNPGSEPWLHSDQKALCCRLKRGLSSEHASLQFINNSCVRIGMKILLIGGLALLVVTSCSAQRNDSPEFFLNTKKKRLAVLPLASGFHPGQNNVSNIFC